MPKNLKNKINNLLEDIRTLSKEQAIRRVEQLIHDEIEFINTEHELWAADLCEIGSIAKGEYQRLGVNELRALGSEENVVWFCRTNAVIKYLRTKGYINFTVNYMSKKKTQY